jgi:ketosteroid isomerase-like protein
MCSEVDQVQNLDLVYETFSKAYQDLDINLMKQIYSEDAYYLSPGAEIQKGMSSFIEGFSNMFDQAKKNDQRLSIEFDIKERKVIDNTAIDIGLYKMTRYSADTSHSSVGKFITVLEFMPEGAWKFIADGYSSAPGSSWTRN